MKKLAPFLTTIIIVTIIAMIFVSLSKEEKMISVYQGNTSQKPLKLDLHHLQDPQCAMVVQQNQYAAQVAAKSGKTWVFDDFGCMVLWLDDKVFMKPPKMWVFTGDTQRWIEAQKAYYSINENTPMRHGFGAYEHYKEGLIDYKEAHLRVLRKEDMTNPLIRKKLLGV